MNESPPLGIMPRKFWIENRIKDLTSAIIRYIDASKEIPNEWINEYDELVNEINKSNRGIK